MQAESVTARTYDVQHLRGILKLRADRTGTAFDRADRALRRWIPRYYPDTGVILGASYRAAPAGPMPTGTTKEGRHGQWFRLAFVYPALVDVAPEHHAIAAAMFAERTQSFGWPHTLVVSDETIAEFQRYLDLLRSG